MPSPVEGTNVRVLVAGAVLTALALALSLMDSALSAFFAFLPGIKLGLANAVTIFSLYYLSLPAACLICAARCILAAVFAGQITAFLFSVFGAFGSLFVMYFLRRKLSLPKVSMLGGVTHNMMQIAAAALVTATPALAWYLPVLVCAGTATGLAMGAASRLLFRRLPYSPRGANERARTLLLGTKLAGP